MYQLWHKYDLVLEVKEGDVIIHRKDLLPFDLRHYNPPKFQEFLQYMTRRLSNLQRTYMNQLYKQRRVGRDNDLILKDSAAISPVDLFWLTRTDLNHTWDSLQVLRDESMLLAKVSLEGILDKKNYFKEKEDHTSIFTTKGAFPKAIYKGYLLKKGDNAEYEVISYFIGKHLGIDVAYVEVWDNGVIACKLFTDFEHSLVHASEYLFPFGMGIDSNIYERAIEVFRENCDIVKELQRLFIFNYLVSNFDLHGENFGFLYDTATFEVTSVSPCYDFNSAFDSWGDPKLYDEFIFKNLTEFINNNTDLLSRLETIDVVLKKDTILNTEQKTEILERAKYLLSLANDENKLTPSSVFSK